jgi:hypothetical protein
MLLPRRLQQKTHCSLSQMIRNEYNNIDSDKKNKSFFRDLPFPFRLLATSRGKYACLCIGFVFAVLCVVIVGLLLRRTPIMMPAPLKAGDTVAFISPASPPCYIFNCTEIQSHIVDSMKAIGGLKVQFGKHAWLEDGYLAGSDAQRAQDLMDGAYFSLCV